MNVLTSADRAAALARPGVRVEDLAHYEALLDLRVLATHKATHAETAELLALAQKLGFASVDR